MSIRFYGACGCPECRECLPFYDEANNPIDDTDSPAGAEAWLEAHT